MRHRHWRGKWSRDEYDATLLVSGFSLGEGIAILALLGGLIALALNPARTSIDHFAATETLLMSTPHRIDWSEQWAIHGEIPASGSEAITRGNTLRQSNGRSIKDPSDLGRFISRVDQRATDGMIVFTLKAPAPQPTIAFRAAFGPGESPATMLWLCGRALVPRGFVRVGADRTSLVDAKLPSPCRGTS